MKIVLYLLFLLGAVSVFAHQAGEEGTHSAGHHEHDGQESSPFEHRGHSHGRGRRMPDEGHERARNRIHTHKAGHRPKFFRGWDNCRNSARAPEKAVVFNVERYGNWSEWSDCLNDSCIEVRYRACLDDSWERPSPNRVHTTKCVSKYYVEKRTCTNKTACTSPVVLANCGIRPNKEGLELKIIGGQPAEPHTWPWAVRLSIAIGRKKPISFCGGTLISPRWILTAAHCLLIETNRLPVGKLVTLADYMRSNLIAHLGDHHKNVEEDAQKDYHVIKAILHPNYHRKVISDGTDIALLYLSSPVEITPQVSYACLPTQKDLQLAPGTKCYALGWGNSKPESAPTFDSIQTLLQSLLAPFRDPFDIPMLFPGPMYPFHRRAGGRRQRPSRPIRQDNTVDELHEVELPIVGMDQCQKHYGEIIDEFHLCAGSKGKDTCSGDSGGGLYCQLPGSPADTWHVVGVTSFGLDRGCGRNPGVYTSVAAHLDWVSKTITEATY